MSWFQNISFFMLTLGALAAPSVSHAQDVIQDNRTAAGYYSRQEWPECVEAFQALIERYPSSTEASIAHFYLGEAFMQLDDFKNAYRAFQQYVLKNPDSDLAGRGTFRMAEASYYLENDATAIRLMEAFIREHPEDVLLEFALPYLGEMRLRRGELQLAAKVFETSLAKFPQGRLADRCVFGLARTNHLLGRYQEAIEGYQLAADDAENLRAAEADIQIAHIFLGQGELDSARQHLERALTHSRDEENSAEASYWLARTYNQQEDLESALEILQPMVGVPIAAKTAVAIYLEASATAMKLGRPQMAFEWLEELLEKYPQCESADIALNLQLEIAFRSEDSQLRAKTEGLINEFMAKHSDSKLRPSVLEKAGRLEYARQNYSSAAEIFERLIREKKFVDSSRSRTELDSWLYLGGLCHIGQQDFVAAEANLGQINLTTASEEIRTLSQLALATARYGQKKYQSAIPCYIHYLSEADVAKSAESENLRRATQELILCYTETGKWAEALESLARLRKDWSHDPVVNQTAEYLAQRAQETGQTQQASQLLEQLLLSGCESQKLPVYLSSLGWLKYETGDTGQAIELFHRLIDEFADSDLAGPAAMAVAKSYDDAKQFDRAAQMYGWVIRHFDQKQFARVAKLRRAHSLIQAGAAQDLPEAKTLLEEFLADECELSARDEALYQLGWVHLELGDQESATAIFNRLVAEHPDSKYRLDAALRTAQNFVNLNQLDKASQALEELQPIESLPSPVRIRKLFLAGEIAARRSEWGIVSETMNQLLPQLDDDSSKTKAYYWLAEASFRQSQYEQAGRHFEFVREHHEQLPSDIQPWLWLRSAQCLGQSGRWREAKTVAEDGLKRFDSFELAYELKFLQGRGLEDSGLLSDAQKIYQEVIDSPLGSETETAAIAQWRIGEIFFHQEDFTQAIQAYYRVDSQFGYEEWRSAALLQAGKCQEHLDNLAHAEKLYTRLIDQFPDSSHRPAAEDRINRLKQFQQAKYSKKNSFEKRSRIQGTKE